MMSLFNLKKSSILVLLILIGAGYAGNYLSWPLFFGVEFLFGSIAVLMVVHLFGIWWGTIAAIIASTYTLFYWGHPYAAILLCGEALFMGVLLQRTSQNIVFLDVIYWGVIGIPLGWLLYPNLLGLDAAQTGIVVFKQSTNGIFNALAASLLITLFPTDKWLGVLSVRKTLSLQQFLINLLLAFVIFPGILLMIVDSHRLMSDITTRIQLELQFTSTALVTDLQASHKQYLRALRELEQIAAESDMVPSDILQRSTELILRTFPNFYNLYVADATGRVIASYPTTNTTGTLILSDTTSNQALLKKTRATLQPAISEVHYDQVLSVPHLDVAVPIVVGNRLQGFTYGSLDLHYIRTLLKSHVSPQHSQITLVDQSNRIIASTQSNRVAMQSFNYPKGHKIHSMGENLYQKATGWEKRLSMLDWEQSFYVEKIPVPGIIPATLVIEIPADPYVSSLYRLYVHDLVSILLIADLAILLAVILSRKLASSLSKLVYVTTDLPTKLLQREAIHWPNSSVREIDWLVRNFKLMALTLNEKFREIQRVNETLEQRVQERTADLLQINQQLANEINERKQLATQLSRREQLLSDYFENASLGLHWVGSDGIILWANRAELELLGYSSEEYIGHHIANFHADQAVIEDILHRLTVNETLHNYEARLRCKDGSIKYVLISSNVFWEEGEFIHTRCFTRDITERRQVEEALRESEQKFRQLAENIDEVFWMSDFETSEIVYISPAYEQVWGRTCESLYANPDSWLDNIHPQDKEKVAAALNQQSQGGYFVEYRLIRSDGSIRWIWDRGFPIQDEVGQVYRCAGIAEDITERKQAEAALYKSEERFRNLVETSSDWVWEVDENTVYTYASPKIWDILGYEPEEVLGKTPFDLMPPEEASRISAIFASISAKRQPFSCLENINIHKEGHLVVLESSGVPFFDSEDRFRGYRGIDRDITERKQAEAEIRHALEKEKQLNDLKSRFITTISHEFRTPLTTILSSAELLHNYSHKATEEQKGRYFSRIQTATRRMTHLLDEVLTIGKAEAGKLEFHPAPLNLEKFCHDLVEEIQLSAGNKHTITFTYQGDQISDATPSHMDEKLLRYILTNLLSNAIKYSPEGGKVYFDLTCESQTGVFRIRDEGIGIPTADQAQVFNSFYRASNVSNISGTGLGLSIVKQCVDLHGGQITVNSEVEVGTTFVVTLPLSDD